VFLLRIGRIGRDADTIRASIFDAPFERIAGKDENTAIVLAGIIELVSGHDRQGTAAQPVVEVIDSARHLHTAALEFGAELVVQLDDLGAVKPSEWVWDTVSLILNARYNDKLTTLITSNFLDGASAAAERVDGPRRAAREETLGDRIGERMRSRLFEMCRLVLVNGKDYRQKFRSATSR